MRHRSHFRNGGSFAQTQATMGTTLTGTRKAGSSCRSCRETAFSPGVLAEADRRPRRSEATPHSPPAVDPGAALLRALRFAGRRTADVVRGRLGRATRRSQPKGRCATDIGRSRWYRRASRWADGGESTGTVGKKATRRGASRRKKRPRVVGAGLPKGFPRGPRP